MSWSGEFHWGTSWAAYCGSSSDNAPHEHVAIQIAVSCNSTPVVIELEGGKVYSGQALVVKSMVIHEVALHQKIGILYLEPQSLTALALLGVLGTDNVELLPDAIYTRLIKNQPIASWASSLDAIVADSDVQLDPRIVRALNMLAANPALGAIQRTADIMNISESRLRTLVREQIGVPLSTWLIWRKLERASQALTEGATLASAAAEGGFSDQAHFTRALRRMFGVTPGAVSKTLTNTLSSGTIPAL